MTFSLPEIQISPKLYTTLKVVFLVGVFLVVALNVISAASAYEFVYCTNEETGITMTYPEGTLCDDDLEEEEEDEEEHEKESDDEK